MERQVNIPDLRSRIRDGILDCLDKGEPSIAEAWVNFARDLGIQIVWDETSDETEPRP